MLIIHTFKSISSDTRAGAYAPAAPAERNSAGAQKASHLFPLNNTAINIRDCCDKKIL